MRVMTWLNRLFVAAMVVICLLAVCVVVAMVQINRAGDHIMMMQTGSMSPLIKPGDLAVVRPVSPATIRPGDVITFREPLGDHLLVTHRVVQVKPTPLGPSFTTKGDNNKAGDPWIIHYVDGQAWKLAFVIPWVGHVPVFLQSGAGHLTAMIAVFFVVLALLWPLLVPRSAQTPSDTHDRSPEQIGDVAVSP